MAYTRSAAKKVAETRKTATAAPPKNDYPQRSSLRRALQVSRRELAVTTAAGTVAAAAAAASHTTTPARRQRPRRGSPRAKTENNHGVPASRRGWYRIRAIVAEAETRTANGEGCRKYLVDWEGRDPRSGHAWPQTWVDAKNVTRSAIREWEERRGSGHG
ncbi:hypothetical protein GGR52DRAFT_251235 [Hypoxylon sp. FL1284]|nr:hypothetical protein GGR52DRAFT_251235 [Hypoxylon sp. FL1284]